MRLQLNTTFNPFTYDEMVKPLLYYKQAYDAAEAAYSNVAAQTEALRNAINKERDPQAFSTFQNYSNELAAAIDNFSQGMTSSNSRALRSLKRRYMSDIIPIADASKRIEERATEQRKLAASNPNLMFDRDFSSEVSIDQMMENPNLSYRAISGDDFYAKGAALAKAMASRMHSKDLALNGQYWEIRNGFGEEAANKFLLDSGAIPELNKALDDLVTTADVPDKLKSRVFEYARQGAISGMVGNTTYTANRGYATSGSLGGRGGGRGGSGGNSKNKGIRPNTTPLFSKSEVAEANKEVLEELDKWKNKGYIDSKGRLTNKGWSSMRSQLLYNATGAANSDNPYVKGASYSGRDEEFFDWAVAHGVSYTPPRKVESLDANGRTHYTYEDPILHSYRDMTNYYNSTRESAANGDLVTGLTNIKVVRVRVKSSSEQQKDLVDLITSANTPIYEAGTLQEDGSITRGDSFTPDEFREIVEEHNIKHLMDSPVGNQQLVELSNGRRFFIPTSVFGESVVNPFAKKGDPSTYGDLDAANAMLRTAPEYSDDAVQALFETQKYLSTLLDTANGEDIDYEGSTLEGW